MYQLLYIRLYPISLMRNKAHVLLMVDGYCKSPNETGSSTIEGSLGYSSKHPLTVDVARPSAGGDFLAAAS